MKLAIPLIIILVVGLLLYACVYTVDFNEIVIVKTFGHAAKPIKGSEGGAGPHFKWPWPIQNLQRYSASTFVFEDVQKEVTTNDQQHVLMNLFCAWRIQDADRFQEKIKTVAAAEGRLRDLLRSENSNVVGNSPLSKFLSVKKAGEAGPGKAARTQPAADRGDKPRNVYAVSGLEDMEQAVLARVRTTAMNDYGVQVEAVGIKSFGLSESVSQKVIANMKEERQRFAEEYRSRGKAYAELIKSRADAAADIIASFADSRSQAIRNQGEAEAARYYAAYKDNERFAIFLRELEFLKQTLKQNTVFVGSSELDPSFGYFQKPPTGESVQAKAGAVAETPKGDGNKDGR